MTKANKNLPAGREGGQHYSQSWHNVSAENTNQIKEAVERVSSTLLKLLIHFCLSDKNVILSIV